MSLQQSGFMQKVIRNKKFSQSDPSIQHTIDKVHITRTLSQPSGQPKPSAIDFQISSDMIHKQTPTIFNPCELMNQDDKSKGLSRTTFKIVDPLSVSGDFSRPPKRFFRTNWLCMTRKLVRKCS